MVQQLIIAPIIENRGAPLESGGELGDNWETLINKCNANFSDLYASSILQPLIIFQAATFALAQAATVPMASQAIQTAGYYSAGDGGGALYFRASGTTPGGFQSHDGQWWQLQTDVIINILQFGARGDQVTDNQPAFQNAVNFIATYNNNGSGSIYVPGGAYMVGSMTHSNVNTFLHIFGDTFATSQLFMKPGVDATVWQADAPYFTLDNLVIWGAKAFADPGPFGSVTPALLINGGSPRFRNCQFLGGNPTIHFFADEPSMSDCVATNSYGDIIQFEEGGWLNRCSFDTNLPAGVGSPNQPVNPWVANTHYNLGDMASLGGYVIQATVGGTSGGSAPALKNYAVNMIDNSVTWQVFSPVNAIGLHMVGICQETHFHQLDNSYPIVIDTTPLSGGSFNFYITDSACSGIIANTGEGLYVSHCELGPTFGEGVNTETITIGHAWIGDVSITDNELLNAGTYGIHVNGGTNTRITNNTINSASSAGVRVRPPATDVIISCNSFSGNAIAVDIAPGVDYYIVTDNLVHNSAIGVNEPTPGTHRTVSGNL